MIISLMSLLHCIAAKAGPRGHLIEVAVSELKRLAGPTGSSQVTHFSDTPMLVT